MAFDRTAHSRQRFFGLSSRDSFHLRKFDIPLYVGIHGEDYFIMFRIYSSIEKLYRCKLQITRYTFYQEVGNEFDLNL